jgi:eukaryotic-like serine/threonine-protein kinase
VAALQRSRWAEAPLPLDRIGRYTILGQIAGGGMGSVFVALMRGPAQFSRLVAVKCLLTRWLDDPKYVARFASEVRLSTRIRHPNVVQTLDVVEEGGELFLVMEYVDGVTLSALLADGGRFERPLPIGMVIGIMASVLRGLHAAHEAADENGVPLHIVHRDVSPQNIMLGRNGHVQVLDFGAAKAVDHSQHTAAGVLVGKLAYMAPEQVRGERSSPRSDVFAAGVVLWEALVNKRLFYDPALGRGEMLHALVLKPVVRPSMLRAGVSAALDEVVRKALDRNPNRRFQNALDFANALEAAGAATGHPAAASAAIGRWVSEVCATRLVEKDVLLRSGMARAVAEVSEPTPTPHHALLVPAPHSVPGFVLAASSRPSRSRRSSRYALGAGGLLLLVGVWASWERAGSFGADAAPGRVLRATAEDAATVQATGTAALGAAPVVAGVPSNLTDVSAAAQASGQAPAHAVDVEGGPATRAARSALAAASQARSFGTSSKRRRSLPFAAAPEESTVPNRRPGCDPPTYMDAAGIRHFKKDCL